ncbi:MAG: glycosyltransferase [Desulfovibrionaceae bacterium]|nr:glycosyltransferase [Desulfovibrionaceae bacterium]
MTLETRPLVSVIMNCRNSSEFLREAIDSVFAQTWPAWEIIFWDNQSEDESPAIAKSYAERTDGMLRYFRAETATPLGEARNLAISRASGKYIAFLDCDDVWMPEKLARQVEQFEQNPRLGLSCTDAGVFKDGRVISSMFRTAAPARGMVFPELVRAGWIAMSAAMLRFEALKGLEQWFDPEFSMAEEADLFYRIAHDWELDFIDAPLTLWRVHANNTTFTRFELFADETRKILNKFERIYPDFAANHPQLRELLQRRAAFQKGVALWRRGKGAQARREIAPWRSGAKFYAFWLLTWLPGSLFDVLARAYLKLPQFMRR